MHLLVLGGTLFLGRHLVAHALASGHRVTVLHRGRTHPRLHPAAETLLADRDGDLAVLEGRSFDAVVDTSGDLPGRVAAVLDRIGGFGHYTFVSSASVYAGPGSRGPGPDTPLAELPEGARDDVFEVEHYGALKRLGEEVLLERAAERTLVLRPGLLVGPHDPSERFTWWPRRLAAGGLVLAPGAPDRRVQLLDARDLARAVLRWAGEGRTGVLDVAGPAEPLDMAGFLAACLGAVGSSCRLVWVDEAFLLACGVSPWTDLPLWLPAAANGLLEIDVGPALAAGLSCRPLVETAADTWAWDTARTDERGIARSERTGTMRVGLDPEREAALLADWQAAG